MSFFRTVYGRNCVHLYKTVNKLDVIDFNAVVNHSLFSTIGLLGKKPETEPTYRESIVNSYGN